MVSRPCRYFALPRSLARINQLKRASGDPAPLPCACVLLMPLISGLATARATSSSYDVHPHEESQTDRHRHGSSAGDLDPFAATGERSFACEWAVVSMPFFTVCNIGRSSLMSNGKPHVQPSDPRGNTREMIRQVLCALCGSRESGIPEWRNTCQRHARYYPDPFPARRNGMKCRARAVGADRAGALRLVTAICLQATAIWTAGSKAEGRRGASPYTPITHKERLDQRRERGEHVKSAPVVNEAPSSQRSVAHRALGVAARNASRPCRQRLGDLARSKVRQVFTPVTEALNGRCRPDRARNAGGTMYAYYFGMNIIWWVFWVVAILAFWALLVPVPRTLWRQRRETPLEVLQRRYASGELTTTEYDERLQRLERDTHGGAQRPLPPPTQPSQSEPPDARMH